jgi:hypothetical protein
MIVAKILRMPKMMEKTSQTIIRIETIMDALENIDVPSKTIIIVSLLGEVEAVAVVEQETPQILIMKSIVLLKTKRVVRALPVLKF